MLKFQSGNLHYCRSAKYLQSANVSFHRLFSNSPVFHSQSESNTNSRKPTHDIDSKISSIKRDPLTFIKSFVESQKESEVDSTYLLSNNASFDISQTDEPISPKRGGAEFRKNVKKYTPEPQSVNFQPIETPLKPASHSEESTNTGLSDNKNVKSIPTPVTDESYHLHSNLDILSQDTSSGYSTFNWSKIDTALKKCIDRNDYSQVFLIANRIEELVTALQPSDSPEKKNDNVPPISVIDAIIRSLAQSEPTNISAPLIIKLLEKVVNKSLAPKLSAQTLSSLSWSVGWISHPYLRYTLVMLIQECISQCQSVEAENAEISDETKGSPPDSLPDIIQHDLYRHLVNSYRDSGEPEKALILFEGGIDEMGYDMASFNSNSLISRILVKNRDSRLAYSYYEKSLKNNRSTSNGKLPFDSNTLFQILESAIQDRASEVIISIWNGSVTSRFIEPSDAHLKSIVEIFGYNELGDVYGQVLRRLSLKQFSQELDDFEVASMFNNAIESDKLRQLSVDGSVTDGPSTFIQLLESCFAYWPNLDYKLLDNGYNSLWRDYFDMRGNFWHFHDPFVKYTPRYVCNTSKNFENEFRTFLINGLLRCIRCNWSPHAMFHTYRKLISEDAFIPNIHTFEELTIGAMFVRNAKLLSNEIFMECLQYGITPSKLMYGLLIRIAARGKNPAAALYYIARAAEGKYHELEDTTVNSMSELSNHSTDAQKNIDANIPNNVLNHLSALFEDLRDNRFQKLMDNVQYMHSFYLTFPQDAILDKSSVSRHRLSGMMTTYRYDLDKTYATLFKEGWPMEKISSPRRKW